jgi:hypothetical protein
MNGGAPPKSRNVKAVPATNMGIVWNTNWESARLQIKSVDKGSSADLQGLKEGLQLMSYGPNRKSATDALLTDSSGVSRKKEIMVILKNQRPIELHLQLPDDPNSMTYANFQGSLSASAEAVPVPTQPEVHREAQRKEAANERLAAKLKEKTRRETQDKTLPRHIKEFKQRRAERVSSAHQQGHLKLEGPRSVGELHERRSVHEAKIAAASAAAAAEAAAGFHCVMCNEWFPDRDSFNTHKKTYGHAGKIKQMVWDAKEKEAEARAMVERGETRGLDKTSHYCVVCRQSYNTEEILKDHRRSEPHIRRVEELTAPVETEPVPVEPFAHSLSGDQVEGGLSPSSTPAAMSERGEAMTDDDLWKIWDKTTNAVRKWVISDTNVTNEFNLYNDPNYLVIVRDEKPLVIGWDKPAGMWGGHSNYYVMWGQDNQASKKESKIYKATWKDWEALVRDANNLVKKHENQNQKLPFPHAYTHAGRCEALQSFFIELEARGERMPDPWNTLRDTLKTTMEGGGAGETGDEYSITYYLTNTATGTLKEVVPPRTPVVNEETNW